MAHSCDSVPRGGRHGAPCLRVLPEPFALHTTPTSTAQERAFFSVGRAPRGAVRVSEPGKPRMTHSEERSTARHRYSGLPRHTKILFGLVFGIVEGDKLVELNGIEPTTS